MKVTNNAFLMVLLLCIFILVIVLDTNDMKRESETYKDMVCSNVWPDYKEIKPDC